ncbi:MAG: hypothetical protein IPF77_14140 [Gemmatimonadetes bacterium]|nr:hypothetical protein [Gemmatimonadota bacterium]
MRLRPYQLSLAALALVALPLVAQRPAAGLPRYRASPLVPGALRPAAPARASVTGMVLAGVTSGAIGLAGGGLIGSAVGGGNAICGDDACGLEEAVYGAIIGESVALPLGVHLANRRRGNYGLSLLASVGIGALGILAVDSSNDGWPLLAVPIGQLVSSILIERATSR